MRDGNGEQSALLTTGHVLPATKAQAVRWPGVRHPHDVVVFAVTLWGARGGRDGEWEAGPPTAGEACLVVQPWWLEHLESGAGGRPAPYPGALPGPAGWPPESTDAEGMRTLRWIYGAVVNAAAAEVPALCFLGLCSPGLLAC